MVFRCITLDRALATREAICVLRGCDAAPQPAGFYRIFVTVRHICTLAREVQVGMHSPLNAHQELPMTTNRAVYSLTSATFAAALVAFSVFAGGCAADTEVDPLSSGDQASGESEELSGKPNADGSCNKEALAVCVSYKGGDACYPRYGCVKGAANDLPPDVPVVGSGTAGAKFSEYYKNNYPAIDAERRKYHNESFGCAATASTALKMYGFSVVQRKVTNEVESQLIALKWTKVTDMKALKAGDVVFTDKATSNIAGTYSHVFVFHNYTGGGTTYAKVSDNYEGNHSRNIAYVQGGRSKSVLAYRAP
jgi:hypothetical protein